MLQRTNEFILDAISRILQIIFAALIIGPFIGGFNVWLFISGIGLYTLFFVSGLSLIKTKEA